MTEEPRDEGKERPSPKVEAISPISPHSKAVYEAGKAMLVSSVETGRDFCKFMIGVSTGAIPIYIGLLNLILPDDFSPATYEAVSALIPAAAFLFASVTFAIGYFPQAGFACLDIIEEIEGELEVAIQKRRKAAFIGFAFFLAGLLLGLIVILMAVQRVSGDA